MDAAIDIDKRIEFAENKVLLAQARIKEQRDRGNQINKRLEREAKDVEDMKKEWINKRNAEEERVKMEAREMSSSHRHAIEDLRVRYEEERQNKLREVKIAILEKEAEINELRKRRDEAVMKTKEEEAKIKAKFQGKINELLRDERSASRRGVVRQKRLLSFR